MRWRNTDFDIKALARTLDNARTRKPVREPSKEELLEKALDAHPEYRRRIEESERFIAESKARMASIRKISAHANALAIWFLAVILMILTTVTSVYYHNDTVLLFPDYSEKVPYKAFFLLAAVIWIFMAIKVRCLGKKAIGMMIIFAIMLIPGAVFAPGIFIERTLEASAFENSQTRTYHDHIRIYSYNVSNGRGGPRYHVDVRPYGKTGSFKVSQADYELAASGAPKYSDNPYCVSVWVEQAGDVIRARSPGYRFDPERQIVKCPSGGLRSENTQHTAG